MKFSDLLRMSSSNLWKRKIRTILTILGVVIGTASIVVMISLGLGLKKSMLEDIEKYGGLTTINVSATDGGMGGGAVAVMSASGSGASQSKDEKRIDDKLIDELRLLPHVEVVSPVLEMSVVAKQGIYENTWLNLKAMDPDVMESLNLKVGEGSLPKKGEPLQFFYGNQVIGNFTNPKSNQSYWETNTLPDVDFMNKPMFVVFDTDAYWNSQGSQNAGIGEGIGSSDTGGEPEKAKPPKKYIIDACGVLEGTMEDYGEYAWITLCDVDALKEHLKKAFKNKAIPGQPTKKGGKPYKEIFYTGAYVKVDEMESLGEVQNAIVNMGYQANSNAEWVESMQSQARSQQAVLGGIGAVSLFVAAIGIANTMMMSIYERTKEIGVIKVLGCGLGNIRTMFLMEAGYIGFIGGAVGIALSYGISALINSVVGKTYGYEVSTSYIPPWLSLVALAFAVFVGMAAGFFPALRAMKLSPLAAIRNE